VEKWNNQIQYGGKMEKPNTVLRKNEFRVTYSELYCKVGGAIFQWCAKWAELFYSGEFFCHPVLGFYFPNTVQHINIFCEA